MTKEDRDFFKEGREIERGVQKNLVALRQIGERQCVQSDRIEEKVNSLNVFAKVATAVAGVLMALAGIAVALKW